MVVVGRAGRSDTVARGRGEDGADVSWAGRPGFLAFWQQPDVSNDNRWSEDQEGGVDRDGSAPELDCLRAVLAPRLLSAAERRGRDLGIGADRVLIQWGVIGEATYLERLGSHLGVALEDFSAVDRSDCPLSDAQLVAAAASEMILLRQDGGSILVLAPQRLAARTLCRHLTEFPQMRSRVRLASASSMQRFLTQIGGTVLTEAAVSDLRHRFPEMSAAPDRSNDSPWPQRLRRGACVAALAMLPLLLARDIAAALLAICFVAFAGLRLAASMWPRLPKRRPRRQPDAALPVYTVVAALYREASSVAPLVAALEALDYPREKLDLVLVLEPGDLATRAAIAKLGSRPHLRVLTAPAAPPQTKPKALNCALAIARGSFMAVFDAEDRPEPNQLRDALAAFDARGPATACVQASLCIDNLSHSWLSRTFVAEYAGQFDLFLPGLTALGLPLPLGGTSNHFRTDVLREIGGWDPYNVTEDADLGFRLARFGYRCASFASTTYEEAPVSFGNWLRQRSRWMKGWIQTWQVHMRAPRRLWRDLGPGGVLALNLIAGGNVLTALAYPLLLVPALVSLADSAAGLPSWLLPDQPTALQWLTIASGFLSTIVVGLLGLARRGELRHGVVLALTPLYWLCLSLAAWRALAHFVLCPYRWEKTTHGVARRAAHPNARSRGERRFADATDSVSDPSRRPRACA
jgi:hypothetical protein